ncbi:hypothetical protein J6590_014059 [Homalodisca vitripennis]|nr:hypothetical protein J6590_014059 [Homalodisca vitripennis]
MVIAAKRNFLGGQTENKSSERSMPCISCQQPTLEANRTHKAEKFVGQIQNKSDKMQELEDESYLVRATATAVVMELAAALVGTRSGPISGNDF